MEASKFFSRRDPSLRGTRRQLLSPSLTQSNSIGRDADDDGTYAPGQSLLDFPGSLEFNGSMDTTCSEFDGDISGLDNDYDNSVTPISSQIFREQTSTPRSRFQNHTGNVSNFANVCFTPAAASNYSTTRCDAEGGTKNPDDKI